MCSATSLNANLVTDMPTNPANLVTDMPANPTVVDLHAKCWLSTALLNGNLVTYTSTNPTIVRLHAKMYVF